MITKCSLWESDSSLNTIDRVELSELDFPAVRKGNWNEIKISAENGKSDLHEISQVTVCPDWPSESLAIQTVYNMWVEFISKNPYYKIAGSTQKHWIRKHWISSNTLPTSRMHTLTRCYFTFFITSFMISNSFELWWHQSPLNLFIHWKLLNV